MNHTPKPPPINDAASGWYVRGLDTGIYRVCIDYWSCTGYTYTDDMYVVGRGPVNFDSEEEALAVATSLNEEWHVKFTS